MKKSKEALSNVLCHVNIKEEGTDKSTECDNQIYDLDVNVTVEQDDNYETSKATSWLNYPWVCGICDINLRSLAVLRDHCTEMHSMCFAAKCVDCTLNIFNFNAFTTHVTGHREELKLYCKYCNFKSTEELDARIHTSKHLEVENLCFICGKLLIKESSSDHCVDMCNITWKHCHWICAICSGVYQSLAILRRHCVKEHSECFSALCIDCGLRIDNYNVYVQHLREHINVLSYYCSICNMALEKDETEHINEVHKRKSHVSCPTCSLIFTSIYHRKKHYKQLKQRPQEPPRLPRVKKEKLTCNLCDMVMKNKIKFKEHMKKHKVYKKVDRKRNCPQCGQSVPGKAAFENHVLVIHGGALTFTCEVCEKTFKSALRLRKHLVTHNPDRSFICDVCSKAFKIKNTLVGHMAIHFGEKNHECHLCYKRFRFAKNLRTHYNVHTGVKPYSCSACPMKFGNWGNCNKHMKRKHSLTLAKTFLTPMGRMPLKSNVLTETEDIVFTEDLSMSHMSRMPLKSNILTQTEDIVLTEDLSMSHMGTMSLTSNVLTQTEDIYEKEEDLSMSHIQNAHIANGHIESAHITQEDIDQLVYNN